MNSLLLELACKSSALVALAFALGPLLRLSAQSRALVFVGAALVLVLLPAAVVFAPSVPLAVLDPPTASGGAAVATAPAGAAHSAPLDVVWWVYLAGSCALLIRLFSAVAALALWTARAQAIADLNWSTEFEKMCARLNIRAPVRLLASRDVGVPLSWGWLRPTILIDAQTLARSADAESVLAHELAHVRRLDWLHLMTLHLAAAIFWFNPLVWLMKRAAQQSAEEAADALALRTVAPVDYAQTLLNCVRRQVSARTLAANTMACKTPNSFARRMDAILAPPQRADHTAPSVAAVAILALCAAPLAAAELTTRGPSLSRVVESVVLAPVQPMSRVAPASRPSASPRTDQVVPNSADRESAPSGADPLLAEIAAAQAEADRLRADAIAADAVADGDPGDMGRVDGMHGRADAAQGWVHALRGDLARLEAEERRRTRPDDTE